MVLIRNGFADLPFLSECIDNLVLGDLMVEGQVYDSWGWGSQWAPDPSRVSSDGALVQGRQRRLPARRAYWLLPMLFVGLQIADIVTTNYALAIPGIWEANPLMAWSQAELGAVWWLPKLAVVGYLCVSASFLRRRWPMIFAVSVSGLAVLGNLTHF
jgi:hypothetical protein